MSKIREIIGSWEPLLGREFRKPYMKTLHEKIEAHRRNVLEGFKPEGDLFEVFKKTPLEKVKVLFIQDTPEFNPKHLDSIESDLFDGFNLSVVSESDYWWLHEQGIMFLPRSLSWGNFGPHREWHVFTDEVILAVTGQDKPILVVTSNVAIQHMMWELRSYQDTIGEFHPWEHIGRWVNRNYNESVDWTPPF